MCFTYPITTKAPEVIRGSCVPIAGKVCCERDQTTSAILRHHPVMSNLLSNRRTSRVRFSGVCCACQKEKQLVQVSPLSRGWELCRSRDPKTAFVETSPVMLNYPVGTVLVPGGERMLTDDLSNTSALRLGQVAKTRTVGFP